MHTQGVNLSSEMIKEMGIRILDGVNELRPDEKKIHVTLSNGPFIDATRTAQEAGRSLPAEKYLAILCNAFPFEVEELNKRSLAANPKMQLGTRGHL